MKGGENIDEDLRARLDRAWELATDLEREIVVDALEEMTRTRASWSRFLQRHDFAELAEEPLEEAA